MVSVNAIVIDPEVPKGPRRWLAQADERRRTPPPPQEAAGAYTFRQHGSTIYRREDDLEYGLSVGVPALIGFAEPAPTLDPPGLLEATARALWPRRQERYELDNAAILYHRRYVCPSRDLDAGSRQSWQRAVGAANAIVASDVVRQQLIDSVRVTTVLPYRLWDIAEQLARLSALRAGHRQILDGVPEDDPDVVVVLAPQRRAHELAVRDIECRVRDLEVFASRLDEAEAALRREEAVRQLAELNDVHRELLAHVGNGIDNLAGDLPATHDVQAVIDQANKAIRAANEAGCSLALPHTDDDSPLAAGTTARAHPGLRQIPRRRERSDASMRWGSTSARSLRNSSRRGYICPNMPAETRESLAR